MKYSTIQLDSISGAAIFRSFILLVIAGGVIFSQAACSTTGSTTAQGGGMDRPVAIGATVPSAALPVGRPVLPRMQNDCLPQAIGMQQALAAKNVDSKIMVVKPSTGLSHATVVFEFEGNHFVWDTQWGAAEVVNASSAQAMGQEWLALYGIPGESRTLVNSYFIN